MKRLLALAALAFSFGVQAQTELILDNVAPAFATTGTWPSSTAVPGYVGPNYQTHEANGTPPGAVVVDNTDPGFSVTGTWPASTSVSGYLGTNCAVRGDALPAGLLFVYRPSVPPSVRARPSTLSLEPRGGSRLP